MCLAYYDDVSVSVKQSAGFILWLNGVHRRSKEDPGGDLTRAGIQIKDALTCFPGSCHGLTGYIDYFCRFDKLKMLIIFAKKFQLKPFNRIADLDKPGGLRINDVTEVLTPYPVVSYVNICFCLSL